MAIFMHWVGDGFVKEEKMDPFAVALAGIVIVLTIYSLVGWKLRYRLPPGPRPLPVLGNLLDIKPVRFRCFWDWSKKYGPIISVWFGSTLNVVVSSSELAKEVLKEHDQQLADRPRTRSDQIFSRNAQDMIWADYGPHYVKVRKLCTLELFSPKKLEALRPVREDEVAAMVDFIYKDCQDQGKPLVVKKYVVDVSFNIITRIVLGKRFMNEQGKLDATGVQFYEIRENGLKFTAALKIADHISYLRWMSPLKEIVFARFWAHRNRLTNDIVEEQARAGQAIGGAKQHFVHALFTEQQKYDLSEDTIIGLLWDMMTAGVDTSAITLEWAMAELIRNPQVQEKAREELDRVIGRDRVINETDLDQLPYLQCITKEALRLHPPTPLMLPHKATQHVKVGGYDIPKGSTVHVNVWAVAKDPAVWKDPFVFNPDRFLEEDVDMKGHDFRLLPFGAGRRVCPGAQLAIYMVQSVLARLLHHFVWTPPKGMNRQDIDLTETGGLVTSMANPVEAIATPRLPAHLYKRVPLNS